MTLSSTFISSVMPPNMISFAPSKAWHLIFRIFLPYSSNVLTKSSILPLWKVRKTPKAGTITHIKIDSKFVGGFRWKGKVHPQPKLPVQERINNNHWFFPRERVECWRKNKFQVRAVEEESRPVRGQAEENSGADQVEKSHFADSDSQNDKRGKQKLNISHHNFFIFSYNLVYLRK